MDTQTHVTTSTAVRPFHINVPQKDLDDLRLRLAQHLPNAQLILYPDSGHGFLFQYHTLFGQHARLFLKS